jgi:hypothetical protein
MKYSVPHIHRTFTLSYVGEGEGKVKLSLCLSKYHAMNTYLLLNSAPSHENLWVSGGIAPGILSFSTRWR